MTKTQLRLLRWIICWVNFTCRVKLPTYTLQMLFCRRVKPHDTTILFIHKCVWLQWYFFNPAPISFFFTCLLYVSGNGIQTHDIKIRQNRWSTLLQQIIAQISLLSVVWCHIGCHSFGRFSFLGKTFARARRSAWTNSLHQQFHWNDVF